MAELADAADSKSAGTWYLGGSTPPPGTTISPDLLQLTRGREGVPPAVGDNALRWQRMQPAFGIVDGDDGGALRAALAVGCLRYRLT